MTPAAPILPAFSTPAGFAEYASEGRWVRCAWLTWLNREIMEWFWGGDKTEEICVVEAPVRHGKSEALSKWLPTWFLGMNPDKKVMLISYAAEVAERWGGQTRDIFEHWGPRCFNHGVCKENASKSQWGICDAHGRPTGGEVYARGQGGQLTSLGAELIIPDDLIKGPEEANSPAIRAKIWELVNTVIMTRRNPGCKVILPMARWNQDDPVGRLLKLRESGLVSVKIIRLPAICETQAERDRSHRDHGLPPGLPDPMGRKPGEALWPERYSAEFLERVRLRDPSTFNSLYQQNPVPREGGMFQPSYFYGDDGQSHILDSHHWQGVNGFRVVKRVCAFDTAAGDDPASCFTVGILMAKTVAGHCVIERIWRGQWAPGERNHRIRLFAESNSALAPAPENFVEQEPGGGGKEAAQSLVKYMAGLPFTRDRVHETKEKRAMPFSTYAHEKNVYLVANCCDKGNSIQQFVDRVCAFPASASRDEVDACSLAFNRLFPATAQEWSPEAITSAFTAKPDDNPRRRAALTSVSFEDAWREQMGF